MLTQNLGIATFCSILAALSVLHSSITLGQPSNEERSRTMSVEQEIRELEEERQKLWYEADLALADRLFADDVVLIQLDPPRMRTKKEFIADLQNRKHKTSHASQDIKMVRVYGDTAIVNLTMSVARKEAGGRDTSFSFISTHVWLKRDGQWKLVSAHRSQTKSQDKPVAERTH